MVSSSVYHMRGLLDQIYAVLTGYGYQVWMSHKGTLPTYPGLNNFENCLRAIDECDLFLGLITGHYGSGVAPGQAGITHQELERAVSTNKPRWLFAHHDVVVARQLLKQFRFKKNGLPRKLVFKPTSVLDDIRCIEMYEVAIRQGLPLSRRVGNWVQEYYSDEDLRIAIDAQLGDYRRIERYIRGATP
jgi:hypothetical protein